MLKSTMVRQVNLVSLVGYLGNDPEIKHTQSGKIFATFSLATTSSWKNKQTGEWEERTQWHRVVVFREATAQFVQKYLQKGSFVLVQGSLETREWEDQGVKKNMHQIVISGIQGQVMLPDPGASHLSVGAIIPSHSSPSAQNTQTQNQQFQGAGGNQAISQSAGAQTGSFDQTQPQTQQGSAQLDSIDDDDIPF